MDKWENKIDIRCKWDKDIGKCNIKVKKKYEIKGIWWINVIKVYISYFLLTYGEKKISSYKI